MDWKVNKSNHDAERKQLNRILEEIAATPSGGGQVDSVVAGTGVGVDSSDPVNPEVSLDAASIASLALADSSTQPGDNVSTLTNDAGYTTNTGTVTSVGMTVPTGLSVAGSPVTTNGTFAVTLTAGYAIPTTIKQTEWDTAYTDRNRWDGGASGLVAGTGRTSLGGTTVGQNIFTVTDPSAVRFLRVNADNSVTLLSDSGFRTAIGAGTSSTTGTVTSVDLANSTGLTASGGPITTSGSLTYTLSANLQAWHGLATSAKQDADSDLTAIAALTPTNDDFMQRKGGVWTNRTVAQVKTDLSLSGTNSGDQTSIVGITGSLAEFNTALTGADFATGGGTATGTNTGDQTTIVGITGTLAQFNTALTGADFATGGGTATGTNTGDQTITLTGDVTGSGTGSFAATLATAQPAVHTWALAQTFTVAPVFTDQSGTRTALGLGTIATQNSNNVTITGGTINGTVIGGSTKAAGSFTTIVDDASGLGSTIAYRVTDANTSFGSVPKLLSATNTATNLPVAVSSAGVEVPLNTTNAVQLWLTIPSGALAVQQRAFMRFGTASAWVSGSLEFARRGGSFSSAASGTVAPDIDSLDMNIRTALSANTTINAPTGTKVNGRLFTIRLRDNGTSRTLSWNAEWRGSSTQALPTATTINKTFCLVFMANADENTMDLVHYFRQI